MQLKENDCLLECNCSPKSYIIDSVAIHINHCITCYVCQSSTAVNNRYRVTFNIDFCATTAISEDGEHIIASSTILNGLL